MKQIGALATRVFVAREQRDMTQEDLARRAGVSRQWLNRLEAGTVNPTFNNLVAVLSALDLELDVIQTRSRREDPTVAAALEEHVAAITGVTHAD